MVMIRVKPRRDLIVLDDKGKPIPARGIEVVKSVRILREIREGSLEVVKTLPNKADTTGGE